MRPPHKLDFAVHYLEVGPNLLSGILPVYLLERPLPEAAAGDPRRGVFSVAEVAREGRYWVPQLDVFQPDPGWVVTDSGQWVRVPVHAYCTAARALATLWGLGVQVGLAALASFQAQSGERPVGVTLVLGTDCTDLAAAGREALRAYAGVAVHAEERR